MMAGAHAPTPPLRIRGVSWLDTATAESQTRDLFIRDGIILADDVRAARTVDGSDLHAMFGLWECHAHAGGLMYDPDASGYFEAAPDRTIRAGENFRQAAEMGITGVRCVDEPDDVDLAWGRAYAAGTTLGPRVTGAGRGIRTTGGHGTAFPRVYTQMGAELVVDGPDAMARAVRRQVERGAQWIKIMLTGGLYSPYESADEGQFTDAELETLMGVANQRHIPVAAHCGGSDPAIAFSELGGRSVEHGYMLDERAAAVMARNGTWLVATIGVTHDQEYIESEGWPEFAANRSRELMPVHAAALHACIDAGVQIAVGADLNPIGPRFHRELEMLERAGMDRRSVLHAASVGGRSLNGFGDCSTPDPGAVADLILVEENPMSSPETLREPVLVITHGRVVYKR
ncbi:MAG: amidohydrolase family protein [Acidimicrobiia bacterium]|nr:amidohydrolase family protein [Acidimicrobiia bacterium]